MNGWPSGSAAEYESAAAVLRTVWFAADFLDDETRSIGWEEIDQRVHLSSHGEAALLQLARDLWGATGVVSLFGRLDARSAEVAYRAVGVRLGLVGTEEFA